MRRARLAAISLAVAIAVTAAPLESAQAPAEPLFVPRVVDVRIESVSLERVDISLQIAVRASRNVTIRTLTFADGFIDKIPVWITPLDGRWPLRRGEELVIPPRVQVTAYARDALGAASLADLVGRKEVDARALVEMSFDTPWLARLFRTPVNMAVTHVAFKAPVPATPPLLAPIARLGAGLLEFMQRQAAPVIGAGPHGEAASRSLLERFSSAVATVETDYEIDGGPKPGPRSARTLGLWWTPSVYCTTREAFEPWRYNPADASQLQIEGGRLRAGATRVRIRTSGAPPIEVDGAELQRRLPSPPTRHIYSLATGEPRGMRLALRTTPSALLCLRVRDDDGPAIATKDAQGVAAPAAVFAVERADALIWTETTPGGVALTLKTPVHRQSLGSPLMTGDGVVGLVASSDTAWDARAIAAAAARPVRISPRPSNQRAGL
jgi:hypothetical protein